MQMQIFDVNESVSCIIKVSADQNEYTFLYRKGLLIGESIFLLEDERQYSLMNEEMVTKTGVFTSEQLKKDFFGELKGWVWIAVDDVDLYRRKAIEQEVEMYWYVKGNIKANLIDKMSKSPLI
ncbi:MULTISPECIES: hypothetical protein [unclassified Bacillus (in: firmicutes)]|uniref:hypothetical protein n=1 Tax=unclassified Bacillus (in: firmicutes) TaxID=185979 RepID=UPI000BF9569F|nr:MULTISPECIES: hypothetical protein [unclassified Bacillus (in: firmicutes)]PEU18133.1 hypothetical protein CN525_13015 [Bacillus sp. AFS014408]PFW62402.1 hypothetical protein COL20_13225 [Bacillus sp. AFS075034]